MHPRQQDGILGTKLQIKSSFEARDPDSKSGRESIVRVLDNDVDSKGYSTKSYVRPNAAGRGSKFKPLSTTIFPKGRYPLAIAVFVNPAFIQGSSL